MDGWMDEVPRRSFMIGKTEWEGWAFRDGGVVLISYIWVMKGLCDVVI